MRSKEESEDYRYFQEPDLVPIVVSDDWRAEVVDSLPELPAVRRRRYLDVGLDVQLANSIGDDSALSKMFDEVLTDGGDPLTSANWLTGEVVAYLRKENKDLEDTALSAGYLVQLIRMVASNELSTSAAKEVLGGVMAGEGDPAKISRERDLIQISDESVLEAAVSEVLLANSEAVERMRAGDMKLVGFLVGQVMKATRGKADPRRVSELVRAAAEV
tara:strand:- start:256 stop:906 length:651 start_codon:yes stop_codon:yes gene_type:complete